VLSADELPDERCPGHRGHVPLGERISNRSNIVRTSTGGKAPVPEERSGSSTSSGQRHVHQADLTGTPARRPGMLVASYDDAQQYQREQIPKFFEAARPRCGP